MSNLRTLVTLPIAAATAILVSTPPATAAPVAAGPGAASIGYIASPVLDVSLIGACEVPGLDQTIQVLAMQRFNRMWAPLALDNVPDKDGNREPLPKVLVPKTMTVDAAIPGWRARHDLIPVPGTRYTAPGPQPTRPTTCTLEGWHDAEPVKITVTGTVVTIPTRLDALLPPIEPPIVPPTTA